MREPGIENVIAELSLGNYGETFFSHYLDWDTRGNKVTELLYFLEKEQTRALYREITKLEEKAKKTVFKSLVELYPLSREIVLYLMRKREREPIDFLEIYDTDKELLNTIQSTLADMKDNSSSRSTKYNNYQLEIEKENEKINQLKNEIEEFYMKSDELNEKREEIRSLEKQLEELKQENEENLESRILELKEEIEKEKEKNREKTEETQTLEKELQSIRENLKEDTLGTTQKEYQKALKALQNCIQSLGERR